MDLQDSHPILMRKHLPTRQKRPVYTAKETYPYGKRDIRIHTCRPVRLEPHPRAKVPPPVPRLRSGRHWQNLIFCFVNSSWVSTLANWNRISLNLNWQNSVWTHMAFERTIAIHSAHLSAQSLYTVLARLFGICACTCKFRARDRPLCTHTNRCWVRLDWYWVRLD
jgi:hypothetical protein